MKFKIKFIIISLIFTLMFISCEKEKVDVMNTFNFTGVWKVNSVEILSDDIDNGNINNIINKEIKLGNNELKIFDNKKQKINYKLRAVKSDYTLSYEKKLTMDKYMDGRETVDLISIRDNNKIIGEFFLNSNDEMLFIYDLYLLKLIRVSNDVVFENDDNEEKEDEFNNYYDFSEGVMIGLKTPREENDDGTYSIEKYRTLWVSYNNYKLGYIYAKDNIIFPRLTGIWKLSVYQDSSNGFNSDEFQVSLYDENDKKEKSIKDENTTNIYKSILFVGNDYIAIKEYIGNEFKGNYPIYKILPVSNVNMNNGLQINEVFNESEKIKYINELKNKINSLSIEEKEGLNIENIYYNNIAIKRELGKWRFVSKILPKNMNEEGEEVNLDILPDKRFINYNLMYISWKDLKNELGIFKDVFISPLYKIALIQFNEYISIYKIEDGNIIAEPLEMIPINENEEVVMAEWCSGKYVEQWEKVFIDGEVILDNNY